MEEAPIRERAGDDLVLRLEDGRTDVVVWEHTVRVVDLVERILALPDVPARHVDRTALSAAAYYHDAGWVIQYKQGQIKTWEIRSRPTSDLQRELAADWMQDRLNNLLEPASLRIATQAVRQCNQRRTMLLEAQILNEAESLDEIGPLALWQQARRFAGEGKGLQDAIEMWNRQKEYRFWEARIKECFRFEQTRRLAHERLGMMVKCFAALAEHRNAEDLDRTLNALPRRPQPRQPT